MDLRREFSVVGHGTLSILGATAGLDELPLSTHVLDLGAPVSLRVVALADSSETFPERQVDRVDRNTMVLALLAITDITPTALLLLKIETGGIRKEDPSEKHAKEAKPGNDIELGLVIDVVVEDGGEQSAGLANASGETVSTGTDRRGENLASYKEGDRVGTELVEE
ncbi:hypothetical protein HG530_012841 [Fusarium avenaceum]|nr:hypothetical protein HG530_012841 [Fusarium avenaceum]